MSEKKAKSTFVDEWGSFTQIPNEFIEKADKLCDQARWLFVLFRNYTNGDSGKIFPSYETIKKCTGWTNKTISKALKDLEKNGWLERKYQFGGVTNYKLKRPPNPPLSDVLKPVTNPSQREHQYAPTGTPIRPTGTTINTETNNTETLSNSLTKVPELPVSDCPTQPDQSCNQGDDFPDETKPPIVHNVVTDDNQPPYPPLVPSKAPKKRATKRISPKTAITETANDHKKLMDYLFVKTGQPILNGGAQGKAVKGILQHYTIEQACEVLDHQLAGNWRGPVSWLSVQSAIGDYFRRKQQTTGANSNGTTKHTDRRDYFTTRKLTLADLGYGRNDGGQNPRR